eukprot:m.470056 g.470056  ORF g.470056 m.470056 type:complete len:371 (+) comp29361_c0_seq1:179-1291(+)
MSSGERAAKKARTAGPVADDGHGLLPARVYWSNQQTGLTAQIREAVGFALPGEVEHRAAMPPFNHRPGTPALPPSLVCYNVPVYGLKIREAAMALFTPSITRLAVELGLPLPERKLDPFLQKQSHKIREVCAAARERADCQDGRNAEALRRLDDFVAAFETVDPRSITSNAQWDAFVRGFIEGDVNWLDNLAVHRVLRVFGFDDATSSVLCATVVDGAPLAGGSLKWLSRALSAYGPAGCFGDLVNLAYAMLGMNPAPQSAPTEDDTVAVLNRFGSVLNADPNVPDSNALWIPTHLVHDAESDDIMTLVLLEHFHRRRSTELQVLVQLPPEPEFDGLTAKFTARPNWRAYRDPDSENAPAIRSHFGIASL